MVGIVSARTVAGQQLYRLQSMPDFCSVVVAKPIRQVAEQSKSCHLGAVPVFVCSSPGRLDGMQIACSERGCKETVAPVDAGVEQADMGHRVAVGGEPGSRQQVVQPFILLLKRQGIKEIRRFLRPSQFSYAVESENRTAHLGEGCVDQKDRALGKPQFSLRDHHLLICGKTTKGAKYVLPFFPDRKPDLPPQASFIFGRKHLGIVRPERMQACRPNPPDGVNQTLVVAWSPDAVLFLGQVIVNKAFEVFQLSIRNEHGRKCTILVLTDVQQLDTKTFPGKTLERQFDLRKALEFNLEAKFFLKAYVALKLGCYRFLVSQLVDLTQQGAAMLGSILWRNRC